MNTIEGVVDTGRTVLGDAAQGSAKLQAKLWEKAGYKDYAKSLRQSGKTIKEFEYENAKKDVTGSIFDSTEALNATKYLLGEGLEKKYGTNSVGTKLKQKALNAEDVNWSKKLNEGSVAGTLINSAEQGLGNMAAFVGLGGIGNVGASTLGLQGVSAKAATSLSSNAASTFFNSFTSAYGNSLTNSLRNGVDEKEAKGKAFTSGLAEAISEQFFQGIPGLKSAGWADKLVSKPISKFFSKSTGKIILKVLDTAGESVEEAFSNILEATFEGIRNKKNIENIWGDIKEAATSEETMEAMLSALISSAIANGGSTVISSQQKNSIIKSYAQEHNMSVKETQQLFDSLIETKSSLEDTSNFKEQVELEDNISKELVQEMKQNKKLDLNELFNQTKQQANINNAIKTGQLSTNGLNLVDSYKAYHGNDGNLSKVKETQTIYDKRGIDARVDATEFKNSDDVSFWETRDGKQYVVINPNADSNAIFQDAAVHELAHDIFAQETKLGNTIKADVLEHVKNDKQYSKLRAEIEEKYSNRYAKDENYEAKIDEEVVAKYLGTNLGTQEYISRLVGEKPNLAQRIYNWVKDKVDNIGKTNEYKQEKAYWKSVADKFEVAYNEQKKNIKINDVRYNAELNNNIENNEDLQYNIDKAIPEGSLINEFNDELKGNEWREYFTKVDRNGIEYQFGNNEKNIVNVNNKIILSSYLDSKPQVRKMWEVDEFIAQSYGTDIETITETIRNVAERTGYNVEEIGRIIDIFNGKEIQTRNNSTSDNATGSSEEQRGIYGQTNTTSETIKNRNGFLQENGRNDSRDVNNTSFSLKQKQLDIIKKNNPVNDDYHTWIRNIDDIKTLEETLQDEDWADYDEINPDLSKQDLLDAIDKGKITVYSSYPIEQGIFVSPSKMEAQSYSGDGKVYSKEVNINDVAWIDPTQGQYAKIDDTNKMYSSKTTDIAPVTKGTRTTMGELFNKNIAPIREDISNLSNQLNNLSNQIQTLQNGAEMTFDNEIAPVNPYRERVLEQREANKYYDELQKDENYWKSLEEFANENSDLDAKSARKLSIDVSKEFGIKPARDLQNIIQTAFDEANSINEIRDNIENTLQQKYDTKTIEQAATYIYDALQETLYENAMKQQNDLENQALQYNENLKEIPIKKKTRQEVRENLQNTMGITTDDLQAGNDIKSFSYQTTTPERVNEKVFGREVGRKINEQTVYFAKHQEAERIRFLNKERQEIKDLGIKARSKESALVQQYGEGIIGDTELAQEIKDVDTQNKIKNAARVLRSKYDTYLDQINEELVEMGYDPIPKRKDYMRHFQELTDKFSQAGIPFNRQELNSENLPTDINGLTEFNVPGKNWFASAQRRTGEKTTYDAITGIDGYLEGASNLMFHTETIQRYRALEKLIRDTYGQTHGLDVFGDDISSDEAIQRIQDIQEGKLSNYAAWLKEQGNAIAGKKGAIDRGVERALGRKGYTFLNTLKKQTGSNMTGFNVRSALTNFISSTIAASKTNKLAMVKGTVATIKNMFHNDGFIDRSDFLTSRLRNDSSLSKKTWQKISNAGQIFMSGSDWFTSNVITRSKYYEGLSKGMTEQQAMKYADDFGARVMGDRSKGATAEAFNSKTLGLLTQFQLETNNQWQYMIHDTKMEFQETLAKDGGLKAGATMLFQMGQLAAYSYLFNEMFEKLTGSRAAFDIADIFKKLFGLDDDEDKDIETRMQEAASELMDALPFTSLFGSGGRLPIGEMLTPAQTIYDAFVGNTNKYGQPVTWEEAGKEVVGSIPYYVLPTGYGQIKKTAQGLGMYANEVPGSYTDSGNLRFTADTDTGSVIKNALFGQWSGEEAKKYRESGYKTIQEKDIPLMNDLNMSSSEFRDFKSKLNDETTTSKKIDGVNYSLYLDNRGNKYWYDKESKIVFDDDMNKTNKKVLDLEKASANELKYNYVSNLPISENNKQKIFDELFTNTIEDKYGYKKYTDKNNKTYWYDEDNDTLYDSKYNKVNKSSIKGLKEVSESKNMSNYKDYGSYEEFDFAYKNPGKYQAMKAIANDYESYKKYVSGIENVRNKYSQTKGYTTEQRKKKVILYVNKLDLTIPQKAMLLRQYYTSFKDYNRQIVNYVSNLDLTYNEKVEILKSLDMKVDKKGNVTWK